MKPPLKRKKETTILRVYSTMQRLKYDFDRFARTPVNWEDKVKIVPYSEIIVGETRIIFKIIDNNYRNIAGYRFQRVIINEEVIVDKKTQDYINSRITK